MRILCYQPFLQHTDCLNQGAAWWSWVQAPTAWRAWWRRAVLGGWWPLMAARWWCGALETTSGATHARFDFVKFECVDIHTHTLALYIYTHSLSLSLCIYTHSLSLSLYIYTHTLSLSCPLPPFLDTHTHTSPAKVVWERLHTAELSWGNQAHIQATRAAHAPQGFDVVCGADLLYQRAALPLLFATCKALLARSGVVLLACKPRNGIGVEAYAEAAQEAGLVAVHTAWMDDVAVLQLRL